jgi:hypothetical protein
MFGSNPAGIRAESGFAVVAMEPQIKETLVALLAAIDAGHGAGIAGGIEKLDGLAAQSGGKLHPQLQHFLERRSYAKALMFLGGETDIPVGACGGGRTAKG